MGERTVEDVVVHIPRAVREQLSCDLHFTGQESVVC